jgi:large subunit ribosomal protein L29
MKRTKPTELRDKSADELTKLAGDKAENLFNLKVRRAAGNLESSADIRSIRRDLARVKTVLGEKQRTAQAGK